MYLDLNSCFATIEQQANPFLRGKPVAVAAYTTPSGCILAPSIEAKKWGVRVGMRVKEGRHLCPELVVLPPDPWKYRHVHLRLKNLLTDYTDKVTPGSIDEFVLNFGGYPAFLKGMDQTAVEIKKRIRKEIGEWLKVSIGIAPNRFLAKTAAGLHKPDGLDEINVSNFQDIYKGLKLINLCGINQRYSARLNQVGIYTVLDFYRASLVPLKAAFNSVVSYFWYLRLRGWEIDELEFARKSFSNSVALARPLVSDEQLAPVLTRLVEKMSRRLRKTGYRARGVHVALVYRDLTSWHQGRTLSRTVFETGEIYQEMSKILAVAPYYKPIREPAVSCFNLVQAKMVQLDLFGEVKKKEKLTEALDKINDRWGEYVVTSARMLGSDDIVHDRIPFGKSGTFRTGHAEVA